MAGPIHKTNIDSSNEAYLLLTVDGQKYSVRWADCSDALFSASALQREIVEVSPSGYGLHWPLLDEDLAVDPLLELTEK